jgi:hypothetical protein
LLSLKLFFHHTKDFFFELDGFLFVKLEQHVFQLALMAVVNHALDSRWDLLCRHLHLHGFNHFFDLSHGPFFLLIGIAFGVLQRFLDTLMHVVFFDDVFLLEVLFFLLTPFFQFGLETFVLVLGTCVQILFDFFVNLGQLRQ